MLGGGAALGLLPFQLSPLWSVGSLYASTEARLVVLASYVVSLARAHAAGPATEVVGTSIARGLSSAALLAVTVLLLHLGGLSLRDDVIERRNTAALAALVGAVLGVGGAFGLALAQGTELAQLLVQVSAVALAVPLSWWGLAALGRTHDLVTIDRDEGAGVRAGVILAGVGLACARGLALGEGSLVRIAASSWPALALVVGGGLFERFVASRSTSSSRLLAVPAALALLAVDLALATDRALF